MDLDRGLDFALTLRIRRLDSKIAFFGFREKLHFALTLRVSNLDLRIVFMDLSRTNLSRFKDCLYRL